MFIFGQDLVAILKLHAFLYSEHVGCLTCFNTVRAQRQAYPVLVKHFLVYLCGDVKKGVAHAQEDRRHRESSVNKSANV